MVRVYSIRVLTCTIYTNLLDGYLVERALGDCQHHHAPEKKIMKTVSLQKKLKKYRHHSEILMSPLLAHKCNTIKFDAVEEIPTSG